MHLARVAARTDRSTATPTSRLGVANNRAFIGLDAPRVLHFSAFHYYHSFIIIMTGIKLVHCKGIVIVRSKVSV